MRSSDIVNNTFVTTGFGRILLFEINLVTPKERKNSEPISSHVIRVGFMT